MNSKHVLNFKISQTACRLIIEDKALFDYFKRNYWVSKNVRIKSLEIKIEGKDDRYDIISKRKKLKISVNLTKKNRVFKDIDWIVRTFFQFNLIDEGVIFLHASSVFNRKGVIAFLGKSGKGKSTIRRNFPKNQIIGDDILIVKKIKKEFYGYQSPFEKSRVNRFLGENKFILSKLFLLVKGGKLKESPASKQKTIELLLSDSYMPRLKNEDLGVFNSFVFDLINSAEVKELEFPKKFKHREFTKKYG